MTVDEVLKILKDDDPEAFKEIEELMKIKVSKETMDKITAAIIKPMPKVEDEDGGYNSD